VDHLLVAFDEVAGHYLLPTVLRVASLHLR
jgi:hypothetical protein